ncbi:hypothetical protein GF356_02445 [candidate division GN15 bacterium]|nr:hypothetical protein [candidate division GN15 bacterium]
MKYQRTLHRSIVMTFVILSLSFLLPAPATFAADEDGFKVGGALRFNYRYMDWDDEGYARINNAQQGELLLDTYRINVDGTYGNIDLSLEYRFYSGYHMLHHGYFGYNFSDRTTMHFGVHQVPFGIQPYASHNWFFSIAYYLGLEDDYDAGIKFMHQTEGGLNLQFAYYKNDEGNFTGASDNSSRYSYDIVDETFFGMQSNNRESHQFNARIAYTITEGDLNAELGVSGQYGMLYNEALDQINSSDDPDSLYNGDSDPWGSHMAIGGHANITYDKFNLMLFGIYVDHDPQVLNADSLLVGNPMDLDGDFSEERVVFGAYDFPYPVASTGIVVAVQPAYTVPVEWGPISSLQFYNDFSMYMKDNEDFENSIQNITGCLVTAGSVYTYVDVAQGKNQPWLGQFTGLGQGVEDAEWKMRFNINFGYYF